jgi:hypothetical protein
MVTKKKAPTKKATAKKAPVKKNGSIYKNMVSVTASVTVVC